MTDVVHIDGSAGEGGGQVLRVATGLAAHLRRPVRITSIRANRPRPGLAAQHLAGIRALVRLTGGRAEGLEVGSREVLFVPGDGLKTRLEVDVGTAGSVTLVLQGLLVALGRTPSSVRLTLQGGTDVAWSPPWAYFADVLCPMLRAQGMDVVPRLVRPGFYPKGAGEVEVSVRGCDGLRPLRPSAGEGPWEVGGRAAASGDLERSRVAERMVTGARSVLPSLRCGRGYASTLSTGCSITLWAARGGVLLGADALGERGVRAEEVGRRAAEDLKRQMDAGGTVDRWASDQLLPFLAMASGESDVFTTGLTSHARTAMEVIGRLLPATFQVEEEGGGARVRCRPAPQGTRGGGASPRVDLPLC